jgi:hypothetical protein
VGDNLCMIICGQHFVVNHYASMTSSCCHLFGWSKCGCTRNCRRNYGRDFMRLLICGSDKRCLEDVIQCNRIYQYQFWTPVSDLTCFIFILFGFCHLLSVAMTQPQTK